MNIVKTRPRNGFQGRVFHDMKAGLTALCTCPSPAAAGGAFPCAALLSRRGKEMGIPSAAGGNAMGQSRPCQGAASPSSTICCRTSIRSCRLFSVTFRDRISFFKSMDRDSNRLCRAGLTYDIHITSRLVCPASRLSIRPGGHVRFGVSRTGTTSRNTARWRRERALSRCWQPKNHRLYSTCSSSWLK